MPTPRFLETESDDMPHSAAKGHIQFLDLTNGEGGERSDDEMDDDEDHGYGGGSPSGHQELLRPHHHHLGSGNSSTGGDGSRRGDSLDEDDGGADGMDDDATSPSSLRSAGGTALSLIGVNHYNGLDESPGNDNEAAAAASAAGPGKIVDSGTEHTGRWTKEEHEAFLGALAKYGKEWKKVAAKVKTRTVVQTRTHAQKYFQKLQKTLELKGGGSIDEDLLQHVDMSVSTESKKSASRAKRSKAEKGEKASKGSSNNNATSSAGGGSGGSGGGGSGGGSGHGESKVYHRRGSAATMSAAQVISTLSNVKSGDFGGSGPHGFAMEAPSGRFTSPMPPSGWQVGGRMKIVAPDPSQVAMRNQFPEPSPAATGKRKLAEMAAARMLAGVGTPDGPPTPPPLPSGGVGGSGPGGLRLRDAPPPPFFGSGAKTLQIVNPESLGVTYSKHKRGDSPVTPWDGELEALLVSAAEKNSAVDDDEKVGSELDAVLPVDHSGACCYPINGPPDAYERTPLHQAVCSQDVDALRTLLDVVNPEDLRRPDEAGYVPLHSACAMLLMTPDTVNDDIDSGENEMVSLLLTAGADPRQLDGKGNCPLHWVGRSGDIGAAVQLLEVGSSDIINCQNTQGETPLHWAMRAGTRGAAVVNLLVTNGAQPAVLDKNFRRAIDVAAEGFLDDELSLASTKLRCQGKGISSEMKKMLKLTARERRETRSNFLICSGHSRTLVLHHPECLEHHTKSQADWEAPDRVRTIMKRILPSSDPTGATETSGIFPHEVTVSQEFDRGSLDLLSRVHSTEYLTFVNKLSKDLERRVNEGNGGSASSGDIADQSSWSPPPVVPFTPMVQRSMIKIHESNVKLSDNSDTSFSVGSLRAARRAAGAVQHAVDSVLKGKNRNAFCVVRPPGHHAGVNGLLEGGESCGFCIFNNVAAGALYAISDDKLQCNKCAIVDIDVHHGNGTEEIVRKCHDPSKLFFFSIHLYDNEKDDKKKSSTQFVYKFYPGTGSKDDLALNIINVPISPLWKEAAPATQRTHNTRHKAKSATQETATDDDSEPSTPRLDGGASDTGSSSNLSLSQQHSVTAPPGRLAYRQAIQNRLLPALRAFNPDLILISAGFDAAKGDVGNARHEKDRERMGLDLEPEDYAWTTRKILEIADICCKGRVISVLEGGYGRTPVATAAASAMSNGRPDLDRGVFGECAVRHLHAMIDPYDAENRFGQ